MTPPEILHTQHLQHVQGPHHLNILQHQQYLHHLQQFNEQQDAGGQFKTSSPLPSTYVPNSAGDNQGESSEKAALPPSVSLLFNSASAGGSSACKWMPPVDCSVETHQISNSVLGMCCSTL